MMTVGKLIKCLEKYDADTEVYLDIAEARSVFTIDEVAGDYACYLCSSNEDLRYRDGLDWRFFK